VNIPQVVKITSQGWRLSAINSPTLGLRGNRDVIRGFDS
jgi:hypothetical protein